MEIARRIEESIMTGWGNVDIKLWIPDDNMRRESQQDLKQWQLGFRLDSATLTGAPHVRLERPAPHSGLDIRHSRRQWNIAHHCHTLRGGIISSVWMGDSLELGLLSILRCDLPEYHLLICQASNTVSMNRRVVSLQSAGIRPPRSSPIYMATSWYGTNVYYDEV